MRVSKLKRKRDRQRKRHEQRPQRVAPISPITGEVQATFSNTDAFGSSPLFNGIVDQRNPTSAGIAGPHHRNRRSKRAQRVKQRRSLDSLGVIHNLTN
jgi:hypothetical protein